MSLRATNRQSPIRTSSEAPNREKDDFFTIGFFDLLTVKTRANLEKRNLVRRAVSIDYPLLGSRTQKFDMSKQTERSLHKIAKLPRRANRPTNRASSATTKKI